MGKSNGKKQETAIVKASEYAIVKDHKRVLDVLRANIGPTGITERDLDRVTIPAGAGGAWCIKTLKGDRTVDAIHGVVIGFKDYRLYWKTPFGESGGGDPPDCKSIDPELRHGLGDPGGSCDECPMNQWSDTKTGRKPCSIYRALFVCGPDDFLPFVLVLPVMSRQACISFFVRLGQKGIQYHGALLKFLLAAATNKMGIKYSKIEMELEEQLAPDVAEHMAAMSAELQKTLGTYSIEETIRAEQQTHNE